MRWRLKTAYVGLCMALAGVPVLGRLFAWLAGLPFGPYKDKRAICNITGRPYVSPRAQVKCPRLSLGAGCFIDDNVTIYAHRDGGAVILGKGVHLYRGTVVEIGAGGSVIIGDNTHVQAGCHLKGFLRNLRIGANVQLAPHCALSPYEHSIGDLSRPILAQGIESKGDIVIQDDVWLGLGVIVLDGVNVGQGAVIGAGAVVTRSIPAYSIAVGVPAKVVRRRGERAPVAAAQAEGVEVD